jgi:Cu/Ag efflux protein CusF
MTMEFPVKDPAEFAKLQPGQKITATVHAIPETFDYWITDIRGEAP